MERDHSVSACITCANPHPLSFRFFFLKKEGGKKFTPFFKVFLSENLIPRDIWSVYIVWEFFFYDFLSSNHSSVWKNSCLFTRLCNLPYLHVSSSVDLASFQHICSWRLQEFYNPNDWKTLGRCCNITFVFSIRSLAHRSTCKCWTHVTHWESILYCSVW